MTPMRLAAGWHWRIVGWGLSAVIVAVFVAANAHLIAVAVATQPDCVAVQAAEGGVALRAARPVC